MFARIALNTNATMQPLYLTTVTKFGEDLPADQTPLQLALVPLVSYICSMLFSVFLQAKITQAYRNRLIPLMMSVVITTCSSVPFAFLSGDDWTRQLVYILAAF